LGILLFFSSRRRHTRFSRDWSSDVCSSDLRSDISQTDWDAVDRPDHDVLNRLDDIEPALGLERVIEFACLQVSGGNDKVRVCDGGENGLHRELKGLDAVSVERDVNFADASAQDLRGGDAREVL